MEFRFYDPELKLIGIMETMKSVLWRRRFYEPGEFTIYCPLTDYNIELCQRGNLVSFATAKEAGVIEQIIMTQEKLINEIKISGRFLSSYMDRRLIRPTVTFSGKVEVAMRNLLMNVQYPLPLVELGELNNFDEEITFQATYKNLLTYETKLSKAFNIGYRFRPDFTARKIYFETYKGVDHSIRQSQRTRVIFAPTFGNMQSAKRQMVDKLLKNVCYVGGHGEGAERTFVTVGDDTLTGLERREVYTNQSGIQQEEGMTEEEYLDLLRTAGNAKLDDCLLTDSFDCTAIPNGNFKYKVDYDLGDTITVQKPDWGIDRDQRMTEITEVYEHGAATIETVFGDPLPETIDWEDKE